MVDLPSDLDRIVQRIVEGYQPEKIILYGSYAWGTPDQHSDFDLFIVKQSDERPIDRRIRVRRLLRDLRVRVPVSPVVLTPGEIRHRQSIHDPFVNQILEDGKVLHGR